MTGAGTLVSSLWRQAKFAEAEAILGTTLEVGRRVLGNSYPYALAAAQGLEIVGSAMRPEQPTRTGGKAAARKPAARRTERAAAPTLSPTALAEAEARATAAEAELLAMLDLDAGTENESSG